MKRPHHIRRKNIRLIAANLYRHCRWARQQRCEEDFVLNNDVGTCGWLPRSVSRGAVAGSCGGGREAVPEVELLFFDSRLAGFVGLDVVGEEIAPVVVRHVVDVGLGALGDTLFSDRADVVGFSVVIPGKNL